MDLYRKVALVTGGNSGLGLEITKGLLARGVTTWVCARNEQSLKQLEQEIQSPYFFTHPCDLRDQNQVMELANMVGRVDILINNAGIWLEGPFESYTMDQIQDVITCNLIGTIFATRAFLPTMKQVNEGMIVNISSKLGVCTHKDVSVYSASKFGLHGFTESLKDELKQTNIKVLGFYPGGMKTPLFEHAGQQKDTSTYIDPKEMAEVLLFMLERPNEMNMDHVVVSRNE